MLLFISLFGYFVLLNFFFLAFGVLCFVGFMLAFFFFFFFFNEQIEIVFFHAQSVLNSVQVYIYFVSL